jgi:CheY-like chemotaxis protein
MQHRATVLCVDDNPATLLSLRAILEIAGHSVLTAATAPDALQILTGIRVDVVLLDCAYDSLAVAHRVKQLQAPAVVLLHTGNPELWQAPPEVVDGVVPKPTPPQALLDRIATLPTLAVIASPSGSR